MVSASLDHVHLRSLDPDAAGRFYVEMLGAAHADRIEGPDSLRVVVTFGPLRLFIERVPPGTPDAPARPHRGLEHIGLSVPDLDSAASELKARGIRFTMEPKTVRPGLRIAFISGPDDASIELLERSGA